MTFQLNNHFTKLFCSIVFYWIILGYNFQWFLWYNKTNIFQISGERTGFVQVGPEKYFFPHKFRASAKDFWNFEARKDDVWVATFPRSGTTWTQEMVWMIANDLDYKRAEQFPLTQRFPFFEYIFQRYLIITF